jgi:hypothetical protein
MEFPIPFTSSYFCQVGSEGCCANAANPKTGTSDRGSAGSTSSQLIQSKPGQNALPGYKFNSQGNHKTQHSSAPIQAFGIFIEAKFGSYQNGSHRGLRRRLSHCYKTLLVDFIVARVWEFASKTVLLDRSNIAAKLNPLVERDPTCWVMSRRGQFF